MIIRTLIGAVLSGYLHTALRLGREEHVYHVAELWAHSKFQATKDAASSVQDKLIEEHGSYRCPSCYWATRKRDEHVDVVGSWCAEDLNSFLGITIEDDLDTRIDRLADDIADKHQQRFGSPISSFG